MEFTKKLIKGKLVKRYKRFFTDVKLSKEIVIAHCPNTGSMMGLLNEGNEVYISKNNDPKRKLKYTLQIIEEDGKKIGIKTHLTNKIVLEALKNNRIKELEKNNEHTPNTYLPYLFWYNSYMADLQYIDDGNPDLIDQGFVHPDSPSENECPLTIVSYYDTYGNLPHPRDEGKSTLIQITTNCAR